MEAKMTEKNSCKEEGKKIEFRQHKKSYTANGQKTKFLLAEIPPPIAFNGIPFNGFSIQWKILNGDSTGSIQRVVLNKWHSTVSIQQVQYSMENIKRGFNR